MKKKEAGFKLFGRYYVTEKEIATAAISFMLSSAIMASNFLYFSNVVEKIISNILNVIGITILVIPLAILEYKKYRDVKEGEDQYPDFLRAITEGLHGGMT